MKLRRAFGYIAHFVYFRTGFLLNNAILRMMNEK